MSEQFQSGEALSTPRIITQEELRKAEPGTRLSIIVDRLFGSNGGAVDGLHELCFVKIGPDHPESWRADPRGQGWFQELPDVGIRPVHINGSRRPDGELVQGESFDYVAMDTVDPDNEQEVKRLLGEGAAISPDAPQPGGVVYDRLVQERLFAVLDSAGKFFWRVSQEQVCGGVVSMQFEQPDADQSQAGNGPQN